MSIYKQLNVRFFEGKEIDKPVKLVFGDRFMATDTGNIYIGNESGEMVQQNPKYTKYVALLSQAGTGDPTDIVLENDTGISIAWTRDAAGEYSTVLSGNISEKTFVSITHTESATDSEFGVVVYSGADTTITIYTKSANVASDALLLGTSFELRIYQ